MLIIGVDPGKTGGAVLLNSVGELREWMFGCEPDDIRRFLHAREMPIKAVIERAQAFPGMGVSSAFNYGAGFGFWQGALTMAGIGFELVGPSKWVGAMLPGRKFKTQPERKRALVAEAIRRWPQIASIPKGKQSGVSDAALLAEFTRTRGR